MNEIVANALERDGITSKEDLCIHKEVIEYLQSKGRFHISMEIGYFHGRTSAIPLAFKPDKHFIIEHHWSTLGLREDKENPCVEVWPFSSQTLPSYEREQFSSKVDYMLIDGEHTKEGLKSDLELASQVLSRHGIAVVDDISLGYPRHIEALEEFCKEHEFLKIFQTDNQAYICRPAFFEEYYKYFLLQMPRKVISDLGADFQYGFKILSGTHSNDDTCFLTVPYFMMFTNFKATPKLEYIGEAEYKVEFPNTFPLINRVDLRFLSVT